ncbi:MAG: hypothetical protein WDW38_007039 [Sanguina aurantia]
MAGRHRCAPHLRQHQQRGPGYPAHACRLQPPLTAGGCDLLDMALTYRTTLQAECPTEAAAASASTHLRSCSLRLLAVRVAVQALHSAQPWQQQGIVSHRCSAVQLQTQIASTPGGPPGQASPLQPHLLAGLLRTAAQEATATSFQVTSTSAATWAHTQQSSDPAPTSAGAAAADVFGRSLQAGVHFSPRLQRELQQRAAPAGAYQLLPRPKGSLDSLVPLPVDISTLQPGQLLLAVRAVGINFRDVLNVLGMYPGDPGDPGSDVSGVIQAGPGSGTTVFGFATGCLASHVITSAMTVAPMPPTSASRMRLPPRPSASPLTWR